MDYDEQIAIVKADQLGKLHRGDDHGVMDCSADIRELKAEKRGFELGYAKAVAVCDELHGSARSNMLRCYVTAACSLIAGHCGPCNLSCSIPLPRCAVSPACILLYGHQGDCCL